jgi:hypothetical protein
MFGACQTATFDFVPTVETLVTWDYVPKLNTFWVWSVGTT